jgi:hypothetical protein
MSEQSKVYANSANTVFFDQNFNLITQIHDAGEWNAHDLNQYGKGDFLGVTTGKSVSANGYNLLEIVFTHDHQYKVFIPFPVSRWRALTVWIFVREDQVTVEAPPTAEEKAATQKAEKAASNQKLIDSINADSPDLTKAATGAAQSSGSNGIIGYVLGGIVVVGILLWALLSRKKGKKLEPTPIIIVPKGKSQSNKSASGLSTPQPQ